MEHLVLGFVHDSRFGKQLFKDFHISLKILTDAIQAIRAKQLLTKFLSLEEPWTLIMDDALANSFVAPVTDDIKVDNQLTFISHGGGADPGSFGIIVAAVTDGDVTEGAVVGLREVGIVIMGLGMLHSFVL